VNRIDSPPAVGLPYGLRSQPIAANVSPKVLYLDPSVLAGRATGWPTHLERARDMGFTHVGVAPVFAPLPGGNLFLADDFEKAAPFLGLGDSADAAVRRLSAMAQESRLGVVLDIVIDRVAAEGAMARSAPGWFHARVTEGVIDPRKPQFTVGALPARVDDEHYAEQLREWWVDRLIRLMRAGAAGFRLMGLENLPSRFLAPLLREVRQEDDACMFLGWTPGVPWSRYGDLEDIGLDGVFASNAWWDGRTSWFVEEHNALMRIAPAISVVEAPFGDRFAARQPFGGGDLRIACRRALRIAAATGQGLLVPMGFERGAREKMREWLAPDLPEPVVGDIDMSDDIRAANALVERLAAFGPRGEMRSMTGAAALVSAHVAFNAADARAAERGVVMLINADTRNLRPIEVALDPLPPTAGGPFGHIASIEGGDPAAPLEAGEVRLMSCTQTKPVIDRKRRSERTLGEATRAPRVAIERVTPSVDDGAFAVKRTIGQSVSVEADIFSDGHDLIAAGLLWKAIDDKDWTRIPLAPLGNDRWRAAFTPMRIGRHVFSIEAWRDDYGSICHDIEAKHKAGVDISLELIEARHYLEALVADATTANAAILRTVAEGLADSEPGEAVAALEAADTRAAVAATAPRPFVTQYRELPLEVERPQAEFASWYELFPRSQSGDANRHGTFRDVMRRLPDIRRMGFDVLYFPPIHPIGRKNRKGRNNALTAAPGDHGSPYAIGSDEGGHDAIHPELGTIDDFRELVAAARNQGLEIALDYAIQCAPDHPWLREHHGWFRWRPDGSVKYAENPPKKYQDIVNVDFYSEEAVPDLWIALRDIVLYWADEGVRMFRVDNPHTKPLPFWQWMIADVRARHPDVIFLSEAFTRPKMMYRLAKIGFSQSYTYFTWRNTKPELADYLTELTTTNVREFFRPHFFVNTPDINPYFLQTSGRPGFLIRAALAATLSGLWGVYSGFELCEGTPLPGREEYLDSEKYEIRVRDQNAPGNIVAEITTLNRIRRTNPALHTHLGVKFYNAFNDQVLLYGKQAAPGDSMILVAVSLDPHHVQEATFELPLWEWKLPDHGTLFVEDLMRELSAFWTGKLQRVRLDPGELPFAVWRVSPPGGVP
jgi:starch synthase (maltosyl-transferring)